MDLYLIRHAHALALGERGITSDADRPLSEVGERQADATARALHSQGVRLDRLFTSPFLRTRQTAEIMLRVWSMPELVLDNCDALTPGGKPRKLSKHLLKSAGERIGLVGHMPQLGDYVAWLIGSRKGQIDLAKSGIALVTCGEAPGKGQGALQWLVTPEWY